MLDLVGNSEDRFSHNEAHIMTPVHSIPLVPVSEAEQVRLYLVSDPNQAVQGQMSRALKFQI